MVTLSRSLQSPVYLARTRRPGMPGRMLSNSSDMSAASTHSRCDDHHIVSGFDIPALEKSQADAIASPSASLGENHFYPRGKMVGQDGKQCAKTILREAPITNGTRSWCMHRLGGSGGRLRYPSLAPAGRLTFILVLLQLADAPWKWPSPTRVQPRCIVSHAFLLIVPIWTDLTPNDDSATAPATTTRSRPIAIEIPKFHSAPDRTPPEPLSARGDVPGYANHVSSVVSYSTVVISRYMKTRTPGYADLIRSMLPKAKNPVTNSTFLSNYPRNSTNTESVRSAVNTGHSPSHTPVASYLPSGAPDTLLPMGKYYPSNYETWSRSPQHQRHEQPIPHSAGPTGLASIRSDSQVPTRSTGPPRHDSEVKRMFQQYQRDMIAQARLAASEVLSGASISSQDSAGPVAPNGAPLKTLQQLGGSNLHKPMAPRLLPLGSPGPVTPMDLEEGGEGGYLERGNLAGSPLGDGEQVTSLRRKGASPSLLQKQGALDELGLRLHFVHIFMIPPDQLSFPLFFLLSPSCSAASDWKTTGLDGGRTDRQRPHGVPLPFILLSLKLFQAWHGA
ncbi:hypothetical protein ACRALDRAFT_1092420 [Sodiomyces alcalophilus JCM 7366]|uniref:uncharacterized protein n=1 Tax=Sodiomyces alcalophilus JCM 7366 TaxID=591952 RepID=UPI0039B4A2FE